MFSIDIVRRKHSNAILLPSFQLMQQPRQHYAAPVLCVLALALCTRLLELHRPEPGSIGAARRRLQVATIYPPPDEHQAGRLDVVSSEARGEQNLHAFLFLEFVLTLEGSCTTYSGVMGSATTITADVGNILMIELPSKQAGMGRF